MQPLILSACIAVGMMLGFKLNDKPENSLIGSEIIQNDGNFSTGRVEELLRFIENKYVDSINSEVLIDEAVQAIFSKLDPHSIYLAPTEVQDAADQMDGAYNGIGIENYYINDTVNISKILPQGSAKRAGLHVFDQIIAIDGKNVAGQKLPYDEIRALLRKDDGADVNISVLRNKKPLQFTMKVESIPVKTVHAHYLANIQTAVIKIDRFGSNTYKEFMGEVEKLYGQQKARHLILDLRDNPGGILPEATNILCQIFEEKDRLLLYTEGRNNKRNEYKSNGKRFFPIEKVVVLIDENSASASEIIAGAVQDWDRGFIIGRRSFGKGLVQEQYDLNNGGAIRLTVAKYFTPSGRSIQRDYTLRDQYDDDLSNRYEHGDYFYKDSSLVKNGGKYFTQTLKRPVSGAGGITPDIFVSMPEIYKNPKAMLVRSYLPEFVFQYVARNQNVLEQYKSDKSGPLDNDIFSAFNKFLLNKKEDFLKQSDIPDLKGFEKEIISQIQTLNHSNVDQSDLISKDDEFLKVAIDVIQTNKVIEKAK